MEVVSTVFKLKGQMFYACLIPTWQWQSNLTFWFKSYSMWSLITGMWGKQQLQRKNKSTILYVSKNIYIKKIYIWLIELHCTLSLQQLSLSVSIYCKYIYNNSAVYTISSISNIVTTQSRHLFQMVTLNESLDTGCVAIALTDCGTASCLFSFLWLNGLKLCLQSTFLFTQYSSQFTQHYIFLYKVK